MAEISHQRDAVAVAADGEVDAAALPHMGDLVGGHANLAAPAMRHLVAGELRPDPEHQRMQARRRLALGQVEHAGPTAEEDARAVRRRARIDQLPLGIGDHAPAGIDRGHQLRRQRLGRDLVALHPDDALVQEAGGLVAVTVGAEEDVPGVDRAAAGLDRVKAVFRRAHLQHRGMRAQPGAVALGEPAQGPVVFGWMEAAVIVDDDAAVVEIRAGISC